MKNNKVKLAEWLGDYTDGYVDIPWPMIHDQVGSDQIKWLNQQPPTDCQMILEKDPKDRALQSLWAEFYVESKLTEYCLRFAK